MQVSVKAKISQMTGDQQVKIIQAALDAAAKITAARIDAGKTTLNTSTSAANDLVQSYRVILSEVIE